MVTTLTGSNGYSLKSKLDEITEEFKKNNSELAIEKVSLDEVEFEDFKQSLLSSSLFSENRLVILDQPSVNKLFIESIEEIFDSLPETTELIIVEPEPDKRSSYYKLLRKTNFIECGSVSPVELIKWIEAKVKDSGGLMSNADARYLVERVGDDQLLIGNEIDKLLLYNEKINRESVDLLTVESPSSTIFNLLDAAFSNHIKPALSIYDNQRKLKVAPEQILSMFVWQLQLISVCLSADKISSAELSRTTKLSPYSLSKAKQIAANLNFIMLKNLVGRLLDIDYLSKTVSFNLDQALKNFIVETATSF